MSEPSRDSRTYLIGPSRNARESINAVATSRRTVYEVPVLIKQLDRHPANSGLTRVTTLVTIDIVKDATADTALFLKAEVGRFTTAARQGK